MKVINTFSNGKKIKTLPQADILLWAASLCYYKDLGYHTKIYCTEQEIQFLKDNSLYDLYDEIDTNTLTNNAQLKLINENVFWACRKMEAIRHEFELGNDFFYSDTDVILFGRLDLDCDLFVWSPEEHSSTGSIYIGWEYLSTPPNYVMPEWFKAVDCAFNCGLLYFKTKELFEDYLKHFYDFVIDNPGVVDFAGSPKLNSQNVINVMMCNAEQRILRAWANYKQLKVKGVMTYKGKGLGRGGHHYFWYRACWRVIGPNSDLIYINMINSCLQIIKNHGLTELANRKYNVFKYE